MHSIASLLAAAQIPLLEARMLLMVVLNKSRIQLITQFDYQLTQTELEVYQQLEQRRVLGEPIAYLTGQREFYGLNFRVTPDVLIPRPDTELLVELALHYAPQHSTLLDLGTGSGAIAVTIAYQRRDLQVWASDISDAALAVAQQNAFDHHCTITFTRSDWYAQLPQRRWQTIVSNPPYIKQHDAHLGQGDLRFEPINALTDHADGLSACRQLITGAAARLSAGGWLLIEHGYDQAAPVRELLAQQPFEQIQSWRDIAGIERVSGGKLT